MKFTAFLLLSSVTVTLVLAFPNNHNKVDDMPTAGLHANAVTNTGAGPATTTVQATQIRQPRHLLKKLFHSGPQLVVQPIVIQPRPYYSNPYAGSGRGYNVGTYYNRW